MSSYPHDFLNDLLNYDPAAWRYLRRRWPGAKSLAKQGCFGLAFALPGRRVLKVTSTAEEIETARRVKSLRPRGVVAVLSVGKQHYIMPRLVEGRSDRLPDAPGVTHHDCTLGRSIGSGLNIMRRPRTEEYVYIDLDGVELDEDLIERQTA